MILAPTRTDLFHEPCCTLKIAPRYAGGNISPS
jgi:hypothetical protein